MNVIFQTQSFEEFKNIVKDVINQYCSKNVGILENKEQIKEAKAELMKMLMDSNFETNQISQLFTTDHRWDEERIVYFVKELNENKAELLYATLVAQNCEYGETITSFDWFLKLVLGTSELNTQRYSILQLILCSIDNNGTPKRNVYDINKDILMKAIEALENLDN